MKRKGSFGTTVILAIMVLLAAFVYVKNIEFGYHCSVPQEVAALRDNVVDAAVSWLGCQG